MRKNVRTISARDVQEQIEELPHEQTLSEESCSQQGPPKKVRGPTKKLALWDKEDDDYRVLVTFDGNGQPVGNEGKELTSFLGTLVKMSQHVNIDCPDWRKFSDDKKEDLWNLVKDTFSFFPVAPVKIEDIKKWVLSDMGLKLKSWKYELKKSSFDPSLTIDEIVAAQQDSRVDETQFRKLVTCWKNEKTQAISDKKKKFRSKSNEPHVTGTKSFARLVHEQKKKNNGVPMSRGATYRMSRTRKDGSVVNVQAAKVIEKLKSISDESSSTTVGIMDYRNDDLAKVKGPEKGGRIRCLGKVVKAKSKESCSLEDPQVPQMKARINELQQEVNEMRETKEKQDAEMKVMKENQEAMIRFMAIVKDQLPNANLSNIFNSLNTRVANDSCSAYVHHPRGNTSASQGSQNENYSSNSRF